MSEHIQSDKQVKRGMVIMAVAVAILFATIVTTARTMAY